MLKELKVDQLEEISGGMAVLMPDNQLNELAVRRPVFFYPHPLPGPITIPIDPTPVTFW